MQNVPPKQSGRLVACFGLPRSASTLVFNIALALLAPTTRRLTGHYADNAIATLALAEEDHDRIVLKAHRPTASLLALLALNDAPRIVTVRDPRDSVSSLMAQFGWSFDSALDFVGASSELLQDLPLTGALVLRYEDARDRAAEWASLIAEHLGLVPDPAELARVGNDLGPESIRDLIDGYVREGLIDASDPGVSFHPDTHWHPNHVGDGEVAKFEAVLTSEQGAAVFRRTRRFCGRFGYAPPVPTPVVDRLALNPETGFSAYLEEGFSYPEPWGTWTDGTRATLRFPLARPAEFFSLRITLTASPIFMSKPTPRFSIKANDITFNDIHRPDAGETFVIAILGKIDPTKTICTQIIFEGLQSTTGTESKGDLRMLGLALRSLDLSVK